MPRSVGGGTLLAHDERVRWKRPLPICLIAGACLLGVVALDLTAPSIYVRTRSLVRDAITRAGRTAPPNPDLVFLAIDSESVSLEEEADIGALYGLTDAESPEARALRLMSRHWPWSREVYALVLERLVEAGAKVVIFDLLFPTPSEGDAAFSLALDRFREQVVIGSNFVPPDATEFTFRGAIHTPPADSLIPQTAARDARVAYVNFWPDEDDVVRNAQFRVTADQVNGGTVRPGSHEFLSLAARALIKSGRGDCVPAGFEERMLRYTGGPRQGFRPRSLFEIFVPEYWERNYKSGEFFRGKTVLVGAEGNWHQDVLATPFGPMPGPELHLNAINAALHGEFIRVMSHRSVALTALGAAMLAVAMSLGIRAPWLRLGALLIADALVLTCALYAFNRLSTYVPSLPTLLQLNVSVLLGLVWDFTRERVEKTRIRHTLEKYVSTNVVRELLDNPKKFQQSLGGVSKPVAILFSDIRGYSTVSARTDPQALVAQLNEYLGAMVECVFKHGGTLDKFIGDAVMAVWGNVRSDGSRNDATNAVRAAIEMREELARLNADWKARGLSELRIGIAVNHGEVVVGNIGSPRRMEFTVIGDAVNVSWKLQELTKQVNTDLLVSKSVASLVVEHFELRRLGEFEIAGFRELFEIFAVPRAIGVAEQQRLEVLEVR